MGKRSKRVSAINSAIAVLVITISASACSSSETTTNPSTPPSVGKGSQSLASSASPARGPHPLGQSVLVTVDDKSAQITVVAAKAAADNQTVVTLAFQGVSGQLHLDGIGGLNFTYEDPSGQLSDENPPPKDATQPLDEKPTNIGPGQKVTGDLYFDGATGGTLQVGEFDDTSVVLTKLNTR